MARAPCLARLLALAAALALAAGKATTPHFKWGQNKDLVFVSVMVRDLDKSSVAVNLVDGDFRFRAKNTKGEEQALDLVLREDVEDSLKFEVSARTDKWGIAVLVTLSKVNKHRWDVLTPDTKKYKGLIDRDWTREDQKLEMDEELPYVEENSGHLLELTAKNLDKTLKKHAPVVVNVRYPWCSQCKSQDTAFAAAAKAAKKKGKKDERWKKIAFAVLDAREERKLAKTLGAKCDYTCEYRVYTEPDEEPLPLKSAWSETELLDAVGRFLGPAVQVVKSDEEVKSLSEKNTTCFGNFASEKSPKYAIFKKVAGLMRGELAFAAKFGKEGGVELWPHKQSSPLAFDGTLEDNGTALHAWVKPRAMPLLQEYDWQLREKYEKLGLPMAKVWINDDDKNPSMDKVVRHAVRQVAKKFLGKLAFVEQKKSAYSYELRDFGLNQPEVYPSFGIASNASYNSIKYGFEITPDVAPSSQDFWKDADKAIARLTGFCEQVLAGSWPEAHESGAPQADWKPGAVKSIVWKTFAEIQAPERPLLLEVFGKYRAENERKLKEVENLAKALEPNADILTVAAYDTAENYLPQGEFKRDKYASDSEWYWVPAKPAGADARPPIKKLMKPKKDAPIEKVVDFAVKSAGSGLSAKEIMERFEEAMEENPPPAPAPMPPFEPDNMEDLGDLGDLSGLGAGGLGGMMGGGLGGGAPGGGEL